MTQIRRHVQEWGTKSFRWDVLIDEVPYAGGTSKTRAGAENASFDAARQALDYLDGKGEVV